MTVVGATYQTILNRLMLQGCQLCDVVHDFRYDPQDNHLYEYYIQNMNNYKLLPRMAGYHINLISKHCNFILINFMSFRILIF